MGESSDFSIRRCFRWALMCGLLPLLAGIGTLFLYLLTRFGKLEEIGFLILLAGPLFFLAGILCWIIGSMRMRTILSGQEASGAGMPIRRLAVVSMLVLLANLPAAVACVAIGSHEMSRWFINIENQTTENIDLIELSFAGESQLIPSLRPASRWRTSFLIKEDGVLIMKVGDKNGDNVYELGYSSSGLGGQTEVTILEDQPPRIVHGR
ncbi:MAG: hypothetical protein IT442_17430 [Phycisphaeraceae bacterium]|nr:hypothetical protein [Phycisphaeraceae bacterium]